MFIKRTDSVKSGQDTSLTIGKTGETFNLSIFGDGFAVNDAFSGILKDYDTDNNGRIEGDELKNLKLNILQAAGEDNVLDENELAQLFTKSENQTEFSEKSSALFKAFLICLKNGMDNIEFAQGDGRRFFSSFNEDGSGVKIYLFDGIEGYSVETFSKGRVKKELISCTNYDRREDVSPMRLEQNLTSHVIYNDDGKVSEQSCIYRGDTHTNSYSEHTLFEYDESGNLVLKIDKHNDTKTGDTSYTTTKYNIEGKILQTTIITNKDGLNRSEVTNYTNDAITSRQIKQEKDDIIVVEEYDGANIDNRMDYLPSKRTVYDKASGNVKIIETNSFSPDGVLIGKIVEDKISNTVQKYDYSKPDGVIDTSAQGGIGNCFFLETVNTLNTTDAGRKILNNMISRDSSGNFKVTFAGVPQIIKDLSGGIKNFPTDKIFIKPEYEITEEEYRDACIRAGKDFSTGDKDVLLLELAYAKYRKNVMETIQANDVDLSFFTDNTQLIAGLDVARGWGVTPEDMGAGGMTGMTMYLFTGKKSEAYFSASQSHPVCHINSDGDLSVVDNSKSYWSTDLVNYQSNVFNKRYDDIEQVMTMLQGYVDKEDGTFKNHAIEVSLPITQQIVNGKEITGGNHAFTVKGIKDGKIILINPWNSSKEVTISIEDFKKSACMINMLTLQS